MTPNPINGAHPLILVSYSYLLQISDLRHKVLKI
jgi:hypothetical protein